MKCISERLNKVDFFRVPLFAILICFGLSTFAQKGGLPLAEEYYKLGEFGKARSIYVNFASEIESAKKIYVPYLDCLAKLEEYDAAEKFYKKLLKWEPQNVNFKIDLADFYTKQNRTNDAKKQFDKVLVFAKEYPEQTSITAQYLMKLGYTANAKAVYLQGRKLTRNEAEFSLEMAEIYKLEKNTPEMLRELIRILLLNQHDKEYLKAKFQDFITTEDEFNKFELEVFARIQEDPSQYLYNDLLIWIYLQQKQFEKAFVQAKAFDKLLKMQGNKVMEVGRLAFENAAFESAAVIFDYVSVAYKNTANYVPARKLKIQSKEALVKSVFPIEIAKIRSLIADYQILISEQGKNRETSDAIRNMALLYGFYLDSKDTAAHLLESVIKSPWIDPQFQAKCKLDLGDIYVLKNEPWEATLIYSQVEKAQKDQPLGNEAKLKNAKIAYFTGQFDFAKEHLDVLKLATHREIANDAMDLALFIQDNTILDDDSTHAALQEYAKVELLIFQNKYSQALVSLDTILKEHKSTSLADEIYYLRAKMYRKLGQFDNALQQLESLGNGFKSDIYGDDAAYMMANIYEENLLNKTKAMELYNKFLIDFPSSIYSVEARKKYRILRGDILN
ncbi:MAG: tetratricopeptide repeat protein [Cytophagales bacterium]